MTTGAKQTVTLVVAVEVDQRDYLTEYGQPGLVGKSLQGEIVDHVIVDAREVLNVHFAAVGGWAKITSVTR